MILCLARKCVLNRFVLVSCVLAAATYHFPDAYEGTNTRKQNRNRTSVLVASPLRMSILTNTTALAHIAAGRDPRHHQQPHREVAADVAHGKYLHRFTLQTTHTNAGA